jgi:hypothetical protein
MPNAVPLDNVQHQNLKVIVGHGPQFGSAVNEVPVFATELVEVAREYAIYFRRDDRGAFQAHALLGLDRNENLFLGAVGWQASYVPAVMNRGPFVIGLRDDLDEKQEPVVMVDLDHPRVSEDGEPMFRSHGGNTPRLERYIRSLSLIHEGSAINNAMISAFIDAGILAPVEINIQLDDRTEYKLPELFSISREAMAGLSGETLETLNKQGFLELAFVILSSVGNVARIIEMKNRKREAV